MAHLSREEMARRIAVECIEYYRRQHYSFNAKLFKHELADGPVFEKAAKEYDKLTDAIEYFKELGK